MGQREVSFGDGDKAITHRMKPEIGAARVFDALIKVVQFGDLPGSACGGRKDKSVDSCFRTPLKDIEDLASNWQLKGFPRFGFRDGKTAPAQIHVCPVQGKNLSPAHTGIKTEPKNVLV